MDGQTVVSLIALLMLQGNQAPENFYYGHVPDIP
jgi:hypothetical protein